MKQTMKNRMGLFVILIFLIMPGQVLADKKAEPEKAVTKMDEMVVTASRVEEKKIELTSNISIIDEKEIKASSAADLGDLLAEKGIGHIQKYPGVLTTIGIRGFRTETHGNDLMGHVLILLNGRRAGTGNVAKIMTKNIERIEIIRGPASVQYGSAAMGGVINIITKQGMGKTAGFLEGTIGSFNNRSESAGLSGKIQGLDFSGSVTNQAKDDYDIDNGDRYHNTEIDNQRNLSLNIGYTFLPNNRIGMIYNNFDAYKIGSPGYFSQNDLDDYTDKSNKSIDFIYDGGTSEGLFSWMIRYFDGRDKNKWVSPVKSDPDGFDAWALSPDSYNNTDYKGTQAQLSYNQEYWMLTGGFDWANYKMHTSWTPGKSEYNNPAGFVLAKVRTFDEKLIITGGVRYDKYKVDMKDNGGTETDNNIASNFGVAWLFTDYMKFRVNYGEAFKMPGADQLAADYTSFGRRIKGNPNLDPEKSKTYEGGMDFYYGLFDSSLTYFSTHFDDKIETNITSDGNSSWKNTGSASIRGLEGKLSCDIGTLLSLNYKIKPYADFVYLIRYKDNTTHEDLKYIDKYHVSCGISISDSKGFSSELNFYYTGEKKIDDWESGAFPTPVIKTGGFTVADLNVSKKIFNFKKYGEIILKAGIQNLFNKDYEYVQGYPMPGRSFSLGIKYDF